MNNVGRPKKTAIDILQTLFWYEYVNLQVCATRLEMDASLTSEEISRYQTHANNIADFFDQIESGIWYKYRNGIKKPKKSTLDYVDLKIPNASVYFYHPIWKFLSQPATSKSLKFLYDSMNLDKLQTLENGPVLNPEQQHLNYSLESSEYLAYTNIMDFYAYILYCYYRARLDLDLCAMQNCIDFLEKNIPFLFQLFGDVAVFFFDVYTKHLKTPKTAEKFIWENKFIDDVDKFNGIRQKDQYQPLIRLIKDFEIE